MRHLALGYEIFVREFDAKLLLAAVAASRGWHVSYGPFGEMVSRRAFLPPGVFWITDPAAPRTQLLDSLASAGHRLVAGDEEGLVHYNERTYIAERLDPSAVEKMERCFFWGDVYARAAADRFPECADRFIASGNPRIDLLRTQFAARRRSPIDAERLEPFILIASNFGGANPFHNDTARFESGLLGCIRDSTELESFYRECFQHQKDLFKSFLNVVPRLAEAFPDTKIVVRAHPSESEAAWLAAACGHSNVVVTREGNIVDWLAACSVMIHNGCTTAIEGFLLDRPCLAYGPLEATEYEFQLPNAVSKKCGSFDLLVGEVRQVLREKPRAVDFDGYDERSAMLSRHIGPLVGPLACDRILDELDRMQVEPTSGFVSRVLPYLYAAKRIGVGTVNAWARLRRGKLNLAGYVKQVSKKDVQEKLNKLKSCLPALSKVRLQSLGHGCFELFPS